MGKVIKFNKCEKEVADISSVNKGDFTLEGTAVCTACSYTWDVKGLHNEDFPLECPNCFRKFGEMKYPVYPDKNDQGWKCDCGNDLFYILKEGFFCRACGNYEHF